MSPLYTSSTPVCGVRATATDKCNTVHDIMDQLHRQSSVPELAHETEKQNTRNTSVRCSRALGGIPVIEYDPGTAVTPELRKKSLARWVQSRRRDALTSSFKRARNCGFRLVAGSWSVRLIHPPPWQPRPGWMRLSSKMRSPANRAGINSCRRG